MGGMINLKINDIPISIEEGASILDAAKKINIQIPTLCHHDDLCVAGNCRVCVVEQAGMKTLPTACSTPVTEGMEILTNTPRVLGCRRTIIELLLSEHNVDCPHCYRNVNCELQGLAEEYSVDNPKLISLVTDESVEISSPSIRKDSSRCIRCQRCVRTCAELQHVTALCVANRGAEMKISTFMDRPMDQVVCTSCGQCINRCPTGALVEHNYIAEIWDHLGDPDKYLVVQTAPAVRVGLGEMLGFDPGTRVTGKMVTALRMIGFDAVFDTNFTADLTIMEEGTELLLRLKKALLDKKPVALPLLTSCSPGWIKYIEHEHHSLLDNLSTCKSPQQMFGPLAKTYYAEKAGIDPAGMIVVSIMPCTAKKFEANRPEMKVSGYKDVDYVLTTREFGRMIKQAGLDFKNLEDSKCDSILGKHTGAGVIFGATGGVAEAALRTVYEIITGREVPFKNLNITAVRGMEGVREASIKIEDCVDDWKFLEGVSLKVAIAHGLANARMLMKQVEKGESPYHFIEVMACPGGCLGGGGQPIPTNREIREKRAKAIYEEDESLELRKSHENPEVQKLYEEFLGKPGGRRSHELLHTSYTARS
ncbi:MAG: 2Fe-2S iron-sulfur cluster binding domain-containing protein [Planctomycetota bacterium]|nr:MAG: 2Fe-2S iron-sulfur cluster binding domain-containing protein [Planctomycetota bacterium]